MTQEIDFTIAGSEEPDPLLERRSVSRKLLVVMAVGASLIVVLTTAAAFLFAVTQTPEVVTEIDLVVDTGRFGNNAEIERRLTTLELIAESALVAGPVSEATGVPMSDVANTLQAETVGRSAVIRFRASHLERDTALAIATAASEQFTVLMDSEDSDLELASIDEAILSASAEIDEIEQRLEEIDAERESALAADIEVGDSAEQAQLLAQYETTLSRLVSLDEQRRELQINTAVQAPIVTPLGPARVVGMEQVVSEKQALALGAFVGILLAAMAVAAIWYLHVHRNWELRLPWVDDQPKPGG